MQGYSFAGVMSSAINQDVGNMIAGGGDRKGKTCPKILQAVVMAASILPR